MVQQQMPSTEDEQQQMPPNTFLMHSPYDLVKQEPNSSPDPIGPSAADMLFASQFSLPSFLPTNNNCETLNLNHRNCTKDRKRPYPCNLCPSRFGSKMELEEHQNSHTGQKPFECDVCKARFNRRSTLWNHKRIHSDAKPFVCSVCQMTFKWKNSLKCHKEMHLRKNESSTVLDADLRQLTYATAAKRNKDSMGGDGHSPLITSAPKKKSSKSSSSASSSTSSNSGATLTQVSMQFQLQVDSPNALNPTGMATLDIDPASLNSLVHQNNGNILVQLCSDVDPNLGTHALLGMDDTNSLLSHSGHLFDIKSELSYPQDNTPSGSNQLSGGCQQSQLNVNSLPLVGNMLNFRGFGQALPSVHHLSTSLPSSSVPMDYNFQNDLNQHYITSPNDMIPSMSYQQSLDQCVVLATGPDYMSNFDYSLINPVHAYDTNASTPVDSHSSVPSVGMDTGSAFDSGKAIPHDRW